MMLRRVRTRVRSLLHRTEMEADLDKELSFHVDMLTEQHVRAGMAPGEARRAALTMFGSIALVKDNVRDTWLSRVVEALVHDVRYGARNLRRSPGYAAMVVITMALGIGANTAIFSVVNGVLLRPLPYVDGDRLVVLHQQRPLAGINDTFFSYQEILDYRAQAQSLDGVVEFHSMWFILLGRPEPERVATGVVSAGFFDVMGVTPLYGRTFVDADDAPGAPAVLVLGHAYWQRSFGGDPSVVGKVFRMNDRPHQVVGILPDLPQYPRPVDVYMPTSACPFRSAPRSVTERNARMMQAFARLKPGVTLQKAQADLDIVAASLQTRHPGTYRAADGYRAQAVPLHEELTRSFRTTLLVLLGTAAFVLLIVCASIANLTVARMVRRQREIAIRSVLGASRARLVRQLLTESTILALAGGAAGLLLAGWGIDLLVLLAERVTSRATEVSIDRTVLLYTLVVSIGTGLVFGAVPAFTGAFDTAAGARDGSRTTHATNGVRSALIVVQVAASFMLLIGAGLTIRTLINLQGVDPGFQTHNLLTMRVDLNYSKYEADAIPAFWRALEDTLRAQPGVLGVGGGGTFPLNDQNVYAGTFRIEGRAPSADGARAVVSYRVASPDYFSTIGQPLLSGRAFTPDDARRDRRVAIINRSLARHHWPGEEPLGRRVSAGDDSWVTIVGVVGDTLQQLDEPAQDEIYLPMFQTGQLSTNWLVRSDVDPTSMERQIRAAVRSLDPDQPVDHFRTVAEVRAASLRPPRLTAALLGLFALLALVITAAGIAGVIALSVNQRTQEFGIRMALGAQRVNVLGMVLRQGLQLVLTGLAIGLAGALVLTRVLASLLFGVQPTDMLTYLAVSMVLVAVAAVACLVPARRAATVDPMVALRVG